MQETIDVNDTIDVPYLSEEVMKASLEYYNGDRLPASTFHDKYALKRASGQINRYAEKTPRDMHHREAREFFRIENKYPNPVSEDIFFENMDDFKRIVPQGSPMYGIGNPYVRVSLSNCEVVASPKDNISSILETGKEIANLFKRRCGVGINISTLRPDGAAVTNSAGSSTGAWSFADLYSFVCRMIGQNGRRGALMLVLSVLHPDIDKFILMKRNKKKVTGANVSLMLTDDFMKAVEIGEDWICKYPIEDDADSELVGANVEEILAKGGYWQETKAGEIEGYWEESVLIPHPKQTVYVEEPRANPIAFKTWVSNDNNEKRVLRSFAARDLWALINQSACEAAEPGLLFWDNYKRNLPANCYPEFKLICVNPCSEIGLSAYDSCRLLSINLKGFVKNAFTKNAYFDYAEFEKITHIAMRMMDDLVDLEIECLQNIIAKIAEEDEKILWGKILNAAERGRRTGLGTHALADTLACLGLNYDSDEALGEVQKIFETFRNCAYDESVNLAIERGAFPAFDWELEKDCEFILRLPEWLQERIKKHGRRNVSLLTVAPTGSVSILSQTSSGLEPVFSNYHTRRKKINPSDAQTKPDYIDGNGDKWLHFDVFHKNIEDYFKINPESFEEWTATKATLTPDKWNDALNKIIPDYFVTSADIDPKRRVEIQGVMQQYIDHGISSTINMPRGTTYDKCQDVYQLAHKCGLKGVTVYVDGSRDGILLNMTNRAALEEILISQAPKRPSVLPCDIHHKTVNGQKWVMLVGMLGDKPYEVFGGLAENIEIPKKYVKGKIIKRKCEKANAKGRMSCYDLAIGEDDDPLIIKDIAVTFNDGDYAVLTRLISQELRHGIPTHYIVEQLSRDVDSGFHSFSRVIARVIKTYVQDGTESSEKCDVCGEKLRFEGGCAICISCGNTTKCS